MKTTRKQIETDLEFYAKELQELQGTFLMNGDGRLGEIVALARNGESGSVSTLTEFMLFSEMKQYLKGYYFNAIGKHKPRIEGKETKITRQEFLDYFRSNDYNEEISQDDKMEVFRTSISSGSDLSVEVFNSLLKDYDCGFQVKKIKESQTKF